MDNPILGILSEWRKADMEAAMVCDFALNRQSDLHGSTESPEWVEMFEHVFRRDDAALARRLMQYFGTPDFPVASDGSLPLMMAAFYGAIDCAAMLVGAGADVDKADADGYTAAHHCMREESARIDIYELLMKAGADPWARASDGARPFEMAVFRWQELREAQHAGGLDPQEFWARIQAATDHGESQRKLRRQYDKMLAGSERRSKRGKCVAL